MLTKYIDSDILYIEIQIFNSERRIFYEYISMSTLDSICKYFHCKIEDIIEFIE